MARTAHLNMVNAGVDQSKSQAKDGAHAIRLNLSGRPRGNSRAARNFSRPCENFPPLNEDFLFFVAQARQSGNDVTT